MWEFISAKERSSRRTERECVTGKTAEVPLVVKAVGRIITII